VNLLQLDVDETVTTVRTVPRGETTGYMVMATTNGTVKRTALEQFRNVRRNGLRAITLDDGDELAWVKVAGGDEDVMLVTQKGQAIRFPQSDVRSMGRDAAGIRMDIVENPKQDLLLLSERGYGKRSALANYRRQKRGGLGIAAAKLTTKTGNLVAARVLTDDDAEAIMMSAEGLVTRTEVKSIRKVGRASQGVIVMRLNKGDAVCSMATLNRADGG
jgi:DNA gyrase subunit A